MRNKKKIVIGILCAIVMVMAVGYALLAQELNITGRASIDSLWQVEITKITDRDIVGGASSKEAPSYTATTASFSVGLIQPGDSITYDIEVTNSGTLDAVLESINVSMNDNEAISYTTSGLKIGDKLSKNGGKSTLTIKIEYNSEITSQPTHTDGNLTVTINCEQNIGQEIGYDAYSVGDIITFAGSNWYVINNSSSEEDYVTLIKEKVLTSEELGEYAANYARTCDGWMAQHGEYGCKMEGETVIVPQDSMPYYWSDTCHSSNVYGYTSGDWSGCTGHNDYKGSKIKEFLEEIYKNMLGANNLKTVDGYKIRLIKKEEMSNYLTLSYNGSIITYRMSDNCPKWILIDGVKYWTMTPIPNYDDKAWYVGYHNGTMGEVSVDMAIRPVINLLKSSI